MPITPSCPGIFSDDLSRDERAIRALPTGITAFVGRAERGPVDEPAPISDFGAFVERFGRPDEESAIGPAVQAFFAHGGARAIVVRIAKGARAAELRHGPIALSAASAGDWGNQLRLRVRHAADGAFHLQLRDGVTGRIETHRDLTLGESPRRVDRVLNARSRLVRWTAAAPDARAALCEHPLAKSPWSDGAASTAVDPAVRGASGGALAPSDFADSRCAGSRTGLFALDKAELVNLLVIPRYRDGHDVDAELWRSAASYCAWRRALLLVEPGSSGASPESLRRFLERLDLPRASAAAFWPACPLHGAPSSGAAAGQLARTDAQRGVWRAPVGLAASLCGVDPCTRDSLRDDALLAAARRTALHIGQSLERGLRWAKSEPNDESLWAEIRARAEAFLHQLFRLGAFAGRAPRDAYFAKCDAETTSARDVERGLVNAVVGFAPLRAGEFATVSVQQSAGAAPV